ncbi:MAG: YggT family protein [Treponema sp.]|jgi:YggT family protein|nr:YggT family protein [Treponema sp.]
MQALMNVLATLTSLYMILIFVRIMLTWFSGAQYGRPLEILSGITDPYLNWFRRFTVLRAGMLDLSPIVAMAVLSLVNQVFLTLARYGHIRLGIILAMLVSALWSAASFLLGFFTVVLILRLIAYLARQDIYYNPFWKIVDTISQPVLYRIKRILFGPRIVNYRNGLIVSILTLVGIAVGLHFLIGFTISLLEGFPL